MSRFYLIRHAEKDTPAGILAARSPGVGLTERGREQARALAAAFAAVPLHCVACSPMQRAQETAAPLAAAKGLEVEIDPAFDEFDFGEWTMKSIDDLDGSAGWTAFNQFRSAHRTPGGESMLEVQARMVGGMTRLRDRFPDQSIAIVSHGDPIRAALSYFTATPLDFWPRFEISIGSITTLELTGSAVQILQVNRLT